ncbi:hypothetical protein BDC45DRAFT_533427 [Circinella umbellata]|nr:hypothetical protein BDC45DRAFT_533427 [Circinella umbellata]
MAHYIKFTSLCKWNMAKLSCWNNCLSDPSCAIQAGVVRNFCVLASANTSAIIINNYFTCLLKQVLVISIIKPQLVWFQFHHLQFYQKAIQLVVYKPLISKSKFSCIMMLL